VGYLPLSRADANMVFQMVSRRYEKGSIVVTSNKSFSKAHRFERTCARWHLKATGSGVTARETPLVDVIAKVVDETFGSHSQSFADNFRIK